VQEGEKEQEKNEGKSNFMKSFEIFKEECRYAPDPKDTSEKEERVFTSIEDLKKIFTRTTEIEDKNDGQTKTDEQIRKLSDEEYFTLFYGEPYAEYVNMLQQTMLDEGYLSENEMVDIETEQDTYPIFIKFADFMISKGYADEEIRQSVESGVKSLIELNRNERPFMERGIIEEKIMNEISAKSSSGNFLDRTISFFISIARAVGEVTMPYCYRPSPPGMDCKGNIKPAGFNGWAYCCNCGLFCSYGCKYVADCSKETCNVQMGCLNAVCPRSAAIWDGFTTGGTGICGCACPGG